MSITLPFNHMLVLQIQAFWDAKKKGHKLFPGEYERDSYAK